MSVVPKKKSIKPTTKTTVKPTTTIKLSKSNEKVVNDETTRKHSVPSNKSDKLLLTKRSETSISVKPDVVPKKLVKSKSSVFDAAIVPKKVGHRNSLQPSDAKMVKTGPTKNTKETVKQSKEISTKQSLSKPLKALPKANAVSSQSQISKTNVMNSTHNVTISSPPTSAGRSRTEQPRSLEEVSRPRDRTRTRTLEPGEIVLLKPKSNEEIDVVPKNLNIKPIAFEINFEEPKKSKLEKEETPSDDYNYESDFESYESDFESEISTSNSNSPDVMNESEKSVENDDDEEESEESGDDDNYIDDERNPAEIKSAHERQMDSGNFDLLTKKLMVPNSQLNSIDENTVHSSDSGISYDDGNSASSKRIVSARTKMFLKRGEEIMKKISLDDMKFNLYETKPIPYEIFMQLYGQRNTGQAFCQTESFVVDETVQTERIRQFSMWTQFPPNFSKEGLTLEGSKLNIEERNGVGEGSEDIFNDSYSDNELKPLVESLNQINSFKRKNEFESDKRTNLHFDQNRLSDFLQNASITIANIVEKNRRSQEYQPSKMPMSQGYCFLTFNSHDILKSTVITKLYTNPCLNNLVITVHHHRNSLRNFLCLWNILHTKNPIKIFSSWSTISCLEVHHNMPEIVFAGCSDGTITLWDSKERIEWKQTIAEDQEVLVGTPCEVVCLNDFGDTLTLINTVAIKSLPQRQMKLQNGIFNQTAVTQICTLHENGFIAIWTVMNIVEQDLQEGLKEILSFLSPSSRVKLVKNLVLDLNAKLGKTISETSKKSEFEKKVYYFENDIFSDKVLKELQQMDEQKGGMNDKNDSVLFHDLDVNFNEFFLASDSNFVMACSRINFDGKSRKINVDSSAFLTSTVVKIHPTDKNILAIGLSNGNLFFINNKMEEEPNDFLSKSQNSSSSKRSSSEGSSSENLLSKSCTIQNIIENERKIYEETQALNNLEMDELKAFLINEALAEQFEEQKTIKLNLNFEKPIFNSFIVNRNEVRSIDFTKEGELMFVLIGDQVKIFNCVLGQELESDADSFKYRQLCCVRGGDGADYLILLTVNNEIVVNKLKK